MNTLDSARAIDWTGCSLVEVVPGKVSGVPILKGTRVQADSIVENYESGSPIEEISENFAIPEAAIQQVLAFAYQSKHARPVKVLFDHKSSFWAKFPFTIAWYADAQTNVCRSSGVSS